MPVSEKGTNKSESLTRQVLGGVTLVISGFLLLIVSFIVTVDVVGRYFFLYPIPGTIEIIRLMMPYICFCAFAYALYQGVHVRVTLISNRFSSGVRRINEILTTIISLMGCGIISYGAWLYFLESLAIKEVMASGADFWIPLWLGKLGLAIGMSLFSFVYLCRLMKLLFYRR